MVSAFADQVKRKHLKEGPSKVVECTSSDTPSKVEGITTTGGLECSKLAPTSKKDQAGDALNVRPLQIV